MFRNIASSLSCLLPKKQTWACRLARKQVVLNKGANKQVSTCPSSKSAHYLTTATLSCPTEKSIFSEPDTSKVQKSQEEHLIRSVRGWFQPSHLPAEFREDFYVVSVGHHCWHYIFHQQSMSPFCRFEFPVVVYFASGYYATPSCCRTVATIM